MCGIAGLVWHHKKPGNAEHGQKVMTAVLHAMHHRGPDGQGIFTDDAIALGHLRLSIIDLAGGAQPMTSPDKTLTLTYNGEIYGYDDRMANQAARGWSFQTKSDSETLIAGYALDGADFDADLNGMYAYALLDRRQGPGRLQVAIDPVGIKPLFFADTGEGFLFASELRGIIAGLTALGHNCTADDRAISEFLTLGWTPSPRSLLDGVQKLQPGARLAITLPGDHGAQASLADLPPRPLPAAQPTQDLSTVLHDSLQRQVVADAPLGFFLSGGIDSSLLVAMAHQMGISPKTFTIRFTGKGHGVDKANEADVAKAVADACGAEHHELSVSADTLAHELDATFMAMDQPLADPACLPLLVMSRFARDTVKVCLSGDGGDELFLGYPRHGLARHQARWQALPKPVQALGRQAMSLLPTAPSTGVKETLRKIRVGGELISAPSYVAGPFSGRYGSVLQSPATDLPHWADPVSPTAPALFEADMKGQLAGQMLPKTDHITMFTSLEVRVPLLDNAMIAAARSLSFDQKRAGGIGKAPLRDLLAQYLPPDITNRPKQGFRVPLTSWFRGDLAADIRARLLDRRVPVAGAIKRSDIESMLTDHITGQAEHSIRIWALLALQNWLDRLPEGHTT